jgi:hypothetical protein
MSLIIAILGQAQVIYEPLDQSVYTFLQRMYVRGLHTENLEVTPLSRTKIAECLQVIQRGDSLLNVLDKQELAFYAKDFASELQLLSNGNTEIESSWHLYRYSDSTMSLVLDPMLGLNINRRGYHRFSGAKLYGQFEDIIGYTFHFIENAESGDRINDSRTNTPATGINIYRRLSNSIEYSDIRATIGVNWRWGNFAMGKDYLNWGMGQRSKLILSSKAPSFPFIRLDINPTEWLRFYYFHGWLQSDVLDSSRTYDSRMPAGTMRRNIYREKYIAAHLVSLTPMKDLNFSFGESIIYSDISPNLLFLNPLLFYRSVDHYLTTKEIGDGNNSQIFFNADYRTLNMLELYGSLFIDEISTSAIFNDAKARNQLGYTLGLILNSPFRTDLTLTAEYTRILPWVYSNFVQTQTYESDGYLLGHYIGQNADQVYLKLEYRVLPQAKVSFFYDYVRKGGLADIHFQYELPSQHFLYGTVTRNTQYGIDIFYEPYHDVRFGVQGIFDTQNIDKHRVVLQAAYGLF